jgi:hypothetical protein
MKVRELIADPEGTVLFLELYADACDATLAGCGDRSETCRAFAEWH